MSGHSFMCDECGAAFIVPFAEYHGQFDHPPSVPVCNSCLEGRESRDHSAEMRAIARQTAAYNRLGREWPL